MELQKDIESRYFDSSHGKMHYLYREGNPKILLIHGFAASARTWGRLLNRLPEKFGICAIDLLGHGESDAPDIEYTFGMHYDTITQLIGELKMDDCFIMGHSYGGWIAAYYATINKPAGIILEDPSGIEEIFKEREFTNPDFKEYIVKKGLGLNPHENVLKSMINADNRKYMLTKSGLGSITSRTLILWGAGDITVNVRYAELFHHQINESKLEILEGEKHTPHYTDSVTVSLLVSRFIDEK